MLKKGGTKVKSLLRRRIPAYPAYRQAGGRQASLKEKLQVKS
jgi:hypothetical protein